MKRVNVFDNKKIENSFCFKNCVHKNKFWLFFFWINNFGCFQ